jgi:hypothetical protein
MNKVYRSFSLVSRPTGLAYGRGLRDIPFLRGENKPLSGFPRFSCWIGLAKFIPDITPGYANPQLN